MTLSMPVRAQEYYRLCPCCGKPYDGDQGDEADEAGICFDCIDKDNEKKKREQEAEDKQ